MTVPCPGCGETARQTSFGNPRCCGLCRSVRGFECMNDRCDVWEFGSRTSCRPFIRSLKYPKWNAGMRRLERHVGCEKCWKCHSCVTANKTPPARPCFPKGIVR